MQRVSPKIDAILRAKRFKQKTINKITVWMSESKHVWCVTLDSREGLKNSIIIICWRCGLTACNAFILDEIIFFHSLELLTRTTNHKKIMYFEPKTQMHFVCDNLGHIIIYEPQIGQIIDIMFSIIVRKIKLYNTKIQ